MSTRHLESKSCWLTFLIPFPRCCLQPLPWHSVPVGQGLALLLGQFVADGVDLAPQEPDAPRPGAAGAHGAHCVQLLQQLLQLCLQRQVSPILWSQDVIHCSTRDGTLKGRGKAS